MVSIISFIQDYLVFMTFDLKVALDFYFNYPAYRLNYYFMIICLPLEMFSHFVMIAFYLQPLHHLPLITIDLIFSLAQ